MDKMREEFEEWAASYRDHNGLPHFTLRRPDGKYVDGRTELCWRGWKASRESFVLHLPHMADYVNMLGQVDKCYSYLDDLHAAIHAAGIRTK